MSLEDTPCMKTYDVHGEKVVVGQQHHGLPSRISIWEGKVAELGRWDGGVLPSEPLRTPSPHALAFLLDTFPG